MKQAKEIIETIVELLNLNEKWVGLLENTFDSKSNYQDGLSSWYKSPLGRFVKSLVAVLFILSISKLCVAVVKEVYISNTFVQAALSPVHTQQTLYVIEMLVLIAITLNIIFFPNFEPIDTPNAVMKAASGSTDRFLSFWPYLWLSWFVLYLILTLTVFDVLPQKNAIVQTFLNACNNLSGVVMFSMYFEMSERTDSNSASHRKNLFIPAGMMLLLVLAFELILTNKLPQHASSISYIFSFVSGISIGVTTGLLVTKLASRFINAPLWAITLLTVYAVIQPVFPIIAQSKEVIHESLAVIIAFIAFYGKICLLGVVHWARDSNRLLYYMARARKIYDEENSPEYRMIFRIATKKLQEEANSQ